MVDLSGYVDVAERIVEFREKYPDGRLRPLDPRRPYWIETIDGRSFVVYVAAAYRTPEDPLPGIGVAWEPFPGPTQFTRDSELQNAETSAWGRALVAALVCDTRRGVATGDEVRNRTGTGDGDGGERVATDAQIATLEREIETRGLPDGIPWPIPRDPRPSMRDASRWIDLVREQPRETPPPVRVSSFRRDLDSAAAANAGSSPAPTPAPAAADPDDARPWERRPFPFDADADTVRRLWRTWIAAVPGIGPVKLLDYAREHATANGLAVPASLDEIVEPELVNAVRLWLTNRADERSADHATA